MKLLKKLYDKSKIWFSLAWIIAYCILMSLGDGLSELLGVEKSITLVIGVLLSLLLFVFLKKNNLLCDFGLCRSNASAKSMLFYIPLLLVLGVNLMFGVRLNYSILETILYIFAMFCVGFLEEVIFRGLLFGAMRENNFKVAVIVCSLTFGIGHIINLLNGSGADLVSNLLQVVYATAAGFMFVMMYCKECSLISCIIVHGLFNALGAFAGEGASEPVGNILSALTLTFITSAYAVYLAITLKADKAK